MLRADPPTRAVNESPVEVPVMSTYSEAYGGKEQYLRTSVLPKIGQQGSVSNSYPSDRPPAGRNFRPAPPSFPNPQASEDPQLSLERQRMVLDGRRQSSVDGSGHVGMSNSRMDVLESRVNVQERAAHGLLDRAIKVKEDIIDNLNITHNTWQGEKKQRELLQDHIRAITDMVKKLDWEIKTLEDKQRSREHMLNDANSSTKQFELQNVAAVSDLRGRVARCDGAITRLVTDVKSHEEGLRQFGAQQAAQFNKLMDRVQKNDLKIAEATIGLTKTSDENEKRVRSMEGGTGQQVALLEQKVKDMVEETRKSAERAGAATEVRLLKLDEKVEGIMERKKDGHKDHVDTLEKKVEKLTEAHAQLGRKMEGELSTEINKLRESQQAFQTRQAAHLESVLRGQNEQLAKLKQEVREGLSTVHETVSTMKSVMDGKLALLEEDMHKEVKQIRKMVVLV